MMRVPGQVGDFCPFITSCSRSSEATQHQLCTSQTEQSCLALSVRPIVGYIWVTHTVCQHTSVASTFFLWVKQNLSANGCLSKVFLPAHSCPLYYAYVCAASLFEPLLGGPFQIHVFGSVWRTDQGFFRDHYHAWSPGVEDLTLRWCQTLGTPNQTAAGGRAFEWMRPDWSLQDPCGGFHLNHRSAVPWDEFVALPLVRQEF